MSDFFESDNSALAANFLEREIRREERARADRRKFITGALSVAVACAVLLGGGFAAYASRQSATKAAAVASAKHVKPSTAKHKLKHKLTHKHK
jgi:hypothetical protein